MVTGEKQKRTGYIDIPVSSFADIAFLLIIFFILATTLQKTMGVLTDLPAGQKTQQSDDKTPTVKLHDGKLYLNDEEIQHAKLKSKLAGMQLHAKTGQDKVVLLEATGKVAYQDYFQTMTAISQAGGIVAIVREEGRAGK